MSAKIAIMFFFSSRRRHTRFKCDWSSDVCSSDLCRCQPGKEISIVVTDQGKGFDFEKIVGKDITSDPAAEHGRGIQLMKAYMDDVNFERRGSEVHMRKRSRTGFRS